MCCGQKIDSEGKTTAELKGTSTLDDNMCTCYLPILQANGVNSVLMNKIFVLFFNVRT